MSTYTHEQPPRISVIMGIYNCASTLDEALQSLYEQTYQRFKVILCDDGSTDGTYEVAKRHADTHDNVILICNERNLGLNATLNHCLEYADTEYVARMDGDDISLPTRFEQEVEFLDSHPEYAIVSGPMIYFDEGGEFRRGKGRGEVKPRDFIKGTPFCHAPCMVRREVYEAVRGYSTEPWTMRVEDYHLWFKMYAAGFQGYNLSEPIYAMRDDRNARSRRTFRNYLNVTRVQFWGYHQLCLPWWARIYLLRSLLTPLCPAPIYKILHRR